MARMATASPARKVLAGSVGTAIATILIWAMDTYVLPDPLPIPIAAAATTLIAFVVGYFTPPSPEDRIVAARHAAS